MPTGECGEFSALAYQYIEIKAWSQFCKCCIKVLENYDVIAKPALKLAIGVVVHGRVLYN